jgi:hypothetical protein
MKFALISFAAPLKGDKHWNLILETVEDVKTYFEASSAISASQFWDLWCSMKKGTDVGHSFNARRHQNSVYGAGIALQMQAEKEGEVSLVEACEIHDRLLYRKLQSMLNIILSGSAIRLHSKGGYSHFDDFFQTHEELECDEKQMREYLASEDNAKFTLSFSKSMVIIENQSMISDELYRKLHSPSDWRAYDNYEKVLNFKYRTENWTAAEFITLFNDAIQNGLHTIIAETTLYDTEQFAKLTQILKRVMTDNPSKTLEAKLLIQGDVTLLEKYTSDLPGNLKVTLL